MKVDEVPQDEGGSIHKAMYAVDPQGRYTTVVSNGWQAENAATGVAIADFDLDLAAARERCLAGLSAPLDYHMCAHRMEVATLAEASGIARWRVRRHLRAGNFARLPKRLLTRYAQALQMPVEELSSLPAQSSR